MAQQFPPSPQENPRQLFSEREEPSMLSTRFWARLFQSRPLLMLGALWLTLICVSAIAYSRLMFSGVPVPGASRALEPVQRSAPPPVIKPTPRSATESGGTPPTLTAPSLEGTSAAGASAPSQIEPFAWGSVGGLLSLVGICALGCLVIAHQARRPPRPKKRRKVMAKVVAKRKPRPGAAPRPKRLVPYSPDRDGVVIAGPAAAQPQGMEPAVPYAHQSQPPLSPAPKPLAAPPRGPAPQARPVPHGAALDTAHPVPQEPDVVPDHEAHPLDWSEASIAHTLDLRQRRSLSSFM